MPEDLRPANLRQLENQISDNRDEKRLLGDIHRPLDAWLRRQRPPFRNRSFPKFAVEHKVYFTSIDVA